MRSAAGSTMRPSPPTTTLKAARCRSSLDHGTLLAACDRACRNAEGEKHMAWVKVTDIAYGRLRAPDLDVMEEFLTRFGLRRTERTANALYMRGTDPTHHIHVTEKGDTKFVGLAYYLTDEDDLKKLAKAPGECGSQGRALIRGKWWPQ